MPITIVSALPKLASPTIANAVAGTETASPELNFISLLFGQIAAIQPAAAEWNPKWAPEWNPDIEFKSADNPGYWQSGDESAGTDDPMELLAALVQAPVEPRGNILPPNAAISDEPPVAERILTATDRLTQDNAAQVKFMPINEVTAKFAVLPDASGENTAIHQEPAGFSTMAVATANIQARHDDVSPVISVPTPLHDSGWNDDFAQKVTWVATQHKQSAELTITPPDMGSIKISLSLDSDKSTAAAVFVSSNPEVRETIETALPRLREMLAGIGIELGQTQVSAESFQQTAGQRQRFGENASQSQSGNDMAILAAGSDAEQAIAPLAGAGHGLVDMFV